MKRLGNTSSIVFVLVLLESVFLLSSLSLGVQESSGVPQANKSDMSNTGASETNLPVSCGTYYEAVVPDTLDLAERAKLGVNHFTSIINPQSDYEMFWHGAYKENFSTIGCPF